MDFSHYTDAPVDLAVALVNTDQRPVGGADAIADPRQLETFLHDYSHLWDGDLVHPDAADLDTLHRLRDRLRRVFEAESEEAAASELNTLLVDNVATPRLSVHGGAPPHLHFEPVDSTLPQWLAVVTAMGLATVITDHGVERFGVCCSDTCQDVFIDTSRNRSRLHCSATCSTREHVAAYRRRQREDA